MYYILILLGATVAFATSIPSSLIEMPQYAIVVGKQKGELYLYEKKTDGIALVKTIKASTGKKIGDKYAPGDLKTPEGIYFFDKRFTRSELVAAYGKDTARDYGDLAFKLNYPNYFDSLVNKDGYGIWLHASDDNSKLQNVNTTKGCVVVSNPDIDMISKFISMSRTPIIIYDNITQIDPLQLEPTRKNFRAMLADWQKSWQTKNLNDYMGFYSQSDFLAMSKNWSGWKAYKSRLMDSYKYISVNIEDLSILTYKNTAIINFTQHYKSDKFEDKGIKTLYLKEMNNTYLIVSEEFKSL